MMVGTEAIIRHALQEGIKITLVVNKIDRLILELRIKPADAYYKIKHTIEEINTFIRFALSSIHPFLLTKKSVVELTQINDYDSALKTETSCLPALT
jgi:translation elongation factor EF-G